jgi:hypothetical protein
LLAISDDEAEEDDDLDGKIDWLRYHNNPKEQVAKWMKETCKNRAAFIRNNKELPVGDLLEQYPRLIDTNGMVRCYLSDIDCGWFI